MTIFYKEDREYVLKSDDDAFLGSLKFEGWSSSKAEMMTQYGDFYNIASKGFWGTTIGVLKGDVEYAELKMNWKGQIVIDLLENGKSADYLLRYNSIWKSQYALEDRNKQEVMIITPDYKWTKWHYDFKIDINPNYTDSIDETLILLAAYSALYMLMMSTGTSGAVS